MTGKRNPSRQATKFGLHPQCTPTLSRERLNKISSGIMASAPVFATGVTQSRNELYSRQCEYRDGKRRREAFSPRSWLRLVRRL